MNIILDKLADEINERFNISITRSMISKWETGKAAPIYDHLKRLALYYNVTTDFLLGFDKSDNLNIINPNKGLNKNNKRVHVSKKEKNIKDIMKLLEDDKLTNQDLLCIQEFIHFLVSRKNRHPYR